MNGKFSIVLAADSYLITSFIMNKDIFKDKQIKISLGIVLQNWREYFNKLLLIKHFLTTLRLFDSFF